MAKRKEVRFTLVLPAELNNKVADYAKKHKRTKQGQIEYILGEMVSGKESLKPH